MAESIACRKVYRFRMEPTELEALELERTASVARYIYNWGLARCRQYYQQHGKSKPWAELSAELTQLKQTELWLYDFDSQMQQQALADLRRAYINFFERRAKFPKFKKKKAARQSFRIPQRVRIGKRIGLCAVDRTGPDSPVAGHRIADQECHLQAHRRRALVRNRGG